MKHDGDGKMDHGWRAASKRHYAIPIVAIVLASVLLVLCVLFLPIFEACNKQILQAGNPFVHEPALAQQGGDQAIQHFSRGGRCNTSRIQAISANLPVQHSSCPNTEETLKALLNYTSPSKPVVLISVGCNKAFDFVNSLRIWTRNESFSVEKLREAHIASGLRGKRVWHVNGACGSGGKRDIPVTSEQFGVRQVQAWCIEPMSANFELVAKSFKILGYLPSESVHVVKAAVSSFPDTAHFPRVRIGDETAGLGASVSDDATNKSDTNGEMDVVDVIALDDMFSKLPQIDFLSIDTEGNDARVIIGSLKLLAAHKVRYFEFEYHNVGHWGTADLSDIVDMLDQFGYDCYFTGNEGQMWRLTGCWHDSYYKRGWSNVACVSRREKGVHAVIEELASRS